MQRYLEAAVRADLGRKMVFLTGPRQVGKTTLARSLMAGYPRAQYLNWDVPNDRRILLEQTWSPRAGLVVLDEIHTFRQSGESLAGRYFMLRLHPVSVREWCDAAGASPDAALDRLMERGGFPEPLLAETPAEAERWRNQYLEGLVREDILEFSRVHELRAMRVFVDMLRERVGAPLSLASLARDLQISPTTLARYLDILEALYVVFTVRPYSRNIARALLKEPKVYFFDTALVNAGEGARFENACAAMLLKHVHYLQDVAGRRLALNYVRDKEGREVDFVVCESDEPIGFAECKLADASISPYLATLSERFPAAGAVQLVRDLRQPEQRGRVAVEPAARWLAELSA
jgi:predicted AAA+ superfamily ATPase